MSALAPRPQEVRIRYVAQARFLRSSERSMLWNVGPDRSQRRSFQSSGMVRKE